MSVDYLTDMENEICKNINAVRKDPKWAIPLLKKRMELYDGNTYKDQFTGATIITNEGPSAINEAIKRLEKQKPAPPVEVHPALVLAARDHARDMGKTGKVGHTGSDGSNVGARVDRYGEWIGTVCENIGYNDVNPLDHVLQLLVDDGVKDRGHYLNLFKPALTHVGVAHHPHSKKHWVTVQVFSGGVEMKKKPKMTQFSWDGAESKSNTAPEQKSDRKTSTGGTATPTGPASKANPRVSRPSTAGVARPSFSKPASRGSVNPAPPPPAPVRVPSVSPASLASLQSLHVEMKSAHDKKAQTIDAMRAEHEREGRMLEGLRQQIASMQLEMEQALSQ